MFSKIAKFRSFGLRRGAPPAFQAVYSSDKHSNDNQPYFRRPAGQRRSPRSGLVCHWILVDGSSRLLCCWQAEDPAASSADEPDQSFMTSRPFAMLYRAAG